MLSVAVVHRMDRGTHTQMYSRTTVDSSAGPLAPHPNPVRRNRMFNILCVMPAPDPRACPTLKAQTEIACATCLLIPCCAMRAGVPGLSPHSDLDLGYHQFSTAGQVKQLPSLHLAQLRPPSVSLAPCIAWHVHCMACAGHERYPVFGLAGTAAWSSGAASGQALSVASVEGLVGCISGTQCGSQQGFGGCSTDKNINKSCAHG